MRIHKNSIVNTLLASIMMMAILLCFSSQAQADQEGDFTYTVTNGEAQITRYTGVGGDVTIPSSLGGYPVTSIGGYAFQDYMGLTSATIPEGVTSIGLFAFQGCQELISISIPSSVTSIGDLAFMNCKHLTSITLPQGLTTIGEGAFNFCFDLKSINIPEKVSLIGQNAFYACYSLASITIPEGVASIGDFAFMHCTGLNTITIPEGVTSIGRYVFCGCTSLTNVIIPQSVTSIGEDAFEACYSLTNVIIPQTVTSIGDHAFYNCPGLTSITFNSATTTIFDDYSTISSQAIIIGYDPSTAFSYAVKYGRAFQSLGTTTPVTPGTIEKVSVNPTYTIYEDVVVSWTAATNATKYLVTLTPKSPSSWVVRWSTATGTSWNEGQLPAGTYDVMVTPFNGQVEGEDSNISSFEVIAPPPGSTKVSVNPTYTNSENIVIKWETSQYADYYYIAVFTRNKNGSEGKMVYSNVDKITVTSIDIGKLPVGNYLARVVPVNSVGNGGACEAVFSVINKPKSQAALFPMNFLQITQTIKDPGTTHALSNAIDICGQDGGIDDLYAPFDCYVMRIDGCVVAIQSVNPVLYADGTVDYMTIMLEHDNDLSDLYAYVKYDRKTGTYNTNNKIIKQGTVFYQEGNSCGAQGNHVHMETGKGKFVVKDGNFGWYINSDGWYQIYNDIRPDDALFLKTTTTIIDGKGLNWRYVN